MHAKVDTDANTSSPRPSISAIPTIMAIREGVPLLMQQGAMSAPELDDLIWQVRSVDMAEVHAEITARAAADQS
jgi:thioredoxin-like negative regulator of GroEL